MRPCSLLRVTQGSLAHLKSFTHLFVAHAAKVNIAFLARLTQLPCNLTYTLGAAMILTPDLA